ncbi:MAG: DNA methyltransferase [Paludibacteraceae bacterium]
MTAIQSQKAAKAFSEFWQDKGYEKGESQTYWLTLLNQVFGVEHPEQFILFEQQVQLDHTSFVDARIPETKVMIEQKSLGKNLGEGIKQSDGSLLNPFQQAKRYADSLPNSQRPRWIVTCNFAEWWVYDLEHPNDEPQKIQLANLENEYDRLRFLVDQGNEHIKREEKVSKDAGKLVGQIYDALLKQYLEPDAPETLRSLNILCVRLVFCLYAEDAHLFGSKTAFHDYLAQYPAKDMRRALIDLFEVLDTPDAQRDPYMDDALKAFPYVNGGLFSHDARLIIPQFTEDLKELILAKASDDFDWNEISPTIFGAIFESTLNPDTRRSGGMHYTSIANIHKVIDPLFLDELKDELEAIQAIPQEKQQRQRLDAFQDKIASLTFFDPACGSGNFLTESYVSLRRLENEVIKLRNKGQAVIGDFANPIKVDIHQFYGIEINDFAVSVATTALWIAEQQMLQETAKLVQFNIEPLPLKAYHNIKEGNALRIDWGEVIAPEKLDFIMGNPPFVGASMMSAEQKEDAVAIFGKVKLSNSIDFVGAWYHLASKMMQANPAIRTALVSTNSITQGEQVAALWQPLFDRYGVHIDFAYRTFRWDSEADIKAHVHCVIIGFSISGNSAKRIYISDLQSLPAANINPYLIDAPDVLVESRAKPICDVPSMFLGNKPTDDGNFILSSEEKEEVLQKEPALSKYIHPYIGAVEFINNKVRYCFWLKDVSPTEIKNSHILYERVQNVKVFREASTSSATRQKANVPHEFFFISQPTSNYLIVPSTSSENRRYIPIGFMSPNIIASNANTIVPNATLYHFGILTSNVHMAWMRIVCGRLKSDYRYSGSVVYNNFPWPNISPSLEGRDGERFAAISRTAQAILDARAKYPDSSLADLYDEVTMPPELRKAHQENDRAVMAAYGFSTKMTESECVAELFKMYHALTK